LFAGEPRIAGNQGAFGARQTASSAPLLQRSYGTITLGAGAVGRPAALTLRFVPRKERITRESLRVFLDSCMATGITSMAAAFRSLPATAGSYCAYIRRIPENVKRTLRRLHRERRAVQRLARKARNLTEPRKPFNLPQAVSGHVDAAGNGCDAPSEALTGY